MSVAELWHCSRSEMKKRMEKGDGLIDYLCATAYIRRKSELEEEAIQKAQHR
jgi:hypothetical protein